MHNTHLHECQAQIIYVLLYSPVCPSINYQLLVFPLLLCLNVEASRYIWAVWKSGSQHGRLRRSIRVRYIQESNFLRPPVPPKFEPKRPRFLVAALCVGLLLSSRPPFASADDEAASTPHTSSAIAPKVCSQWLINVERGQVIGNDLEFVISLYLKFLFAGEN